MAVGPVTIANQRLDGDSGTYSNDKRQTGISLAQTVPKDGRTGWIQLSEYRFGASTVSQQAFMREGVAPHNALSAYDWPERFVTVHCLHGGSFTNQTERTFSPQVLQMAHYDFLIINPLMSVSLAVSGQFTS